MDATTQRSLVARILNHRNAGTRDLADSIASFPVDDYLSDEVLRREMASAFTPSFLIVAHESQLAKSGDYLADTILGVPIVVVRTSSGELKGFVNVCRHRRMKLLEDRAGEGLTSFVCRYHAWRYDLSGLLQNVPDKERGFPELQLSECGLLPVEVEVRHGMVWVSLRPRQPDRHRDGVAAHLGPVDDELTTLGVANQTLYRVDTFTPKFNWKLGVEASLEVYHLRSLHPIAVHPELREYANASRTSLVDSLAKHIRMVVPRDSVESNRGIPEADHLIQPHATVVYQMFPATIAVVEKRRVAWMQFRPLSSGSCYVTVHHVIQRDSGKPGRYWEDSLRQFSQTIDEDFAACESIQEGCQTAVSDGTESSQNVLFGRNELGLQMFRANLIECLAKSDGRQS